MWKKTHSVVGFDEYMFDSDGFFLWGNINDILDI